MKILPKTDSAPSAGLAEPLAVFSALLALLAISASTTLLPPSAWKGPAGLLIAAAKAALIVTFFMRLRSARGLVRVFAAAGLFWLAILGALILADYLTRA